MRKRYPLLWVSGFMVAIGLMVFDEVLTLARYCGPDCYYAVPYIGGLTQYGAEIFGWLLILAGFAIVMAASMMQDRYISPDLALALKEYLEGQTKGEPDQ